MALKEGAMVKSKLGAKVDLCWQACLISTSRPEGATKHWRR